MNTIPHINSYISNSKTTKFLNKFKSKISVTGSNGVAEILNGNFSDLNSSNKQFSNKDKNQWKESFEECNNFYIVNGYEKEIEKKYPEELRIFKKISLTSSDQKPNFQYQIDNSLKPKKSKESNFYGYTPYNITSFKAKFEGKVVLPRSLGSNVGSDEWNKQFGLRSKLKEFSDKYKTIKIKRESQIQINNMKKKSSKF